MMKKIVCQLLFILLLFVGCREKDMESPDIEKPKSDTLFRETFDQLDTTIWTIQNNYSEGYITGNNIYTGIVKRSLYTDEIDNCLCIYARKSKYIVSGPIFSRAYFDLTDLNPKRMLKIGYTFETSSYKFNFNVINISSNETLVHKSFRQDYGIYLDTVLSNSYKESDTLRFQFENWPDSYAGYESYIDDVIIIELDN